MDEGRWITTKYGARVFIKNTNAYMNEKIRNGKLNDKEIEAIDFWKEGNEGWGYQALQYASQNNLENYGQIKLQRQNMNDSKADYLKEQYQELYKNFKNALNKAPNVSDNTYLYRYENTYRVPNIDDEVKLHELSSFTLKPDYKMTQQYGGRDKIVYKVKGGKDYKDISNIGNSFTQENEVLLTNKKTYKVEKIDREDFFGEIQYIITLK